MLSAASQIHQFHDEITLETTLGLDGVPLIVDGVEKVWLMRARQAPFVCPMTYLTRSMFSALRGFNDSKRALDAWFIEAKECCDPEDYCLDACPFGAVERPWGPN